MNTSQLKAATKVRLAGLEPSVLSLPAKAVMLLSKHKPSNCLESIRILEREASKTRGIGRRTLERIERDVNRVILSVETDSEQSTSKVLSHNEQIAEKIHLVLREEGREPIRREQLFRRVMQQIECDRRELISCLREMRDVDQFDLEGRSYVSARYR